jgi:hypothetical protein
MDAHTLEGKLPQSRASSYCHRKLHIGVALLEDTQAGRLGNVSESNVEELLARSSSADAIYLPLPGGWFPAWR